MKYINFSFISLPGASLLPWVVPIMFWTLLLHTGAGWAPDQAGGGGGLPPPPSLWTTRGRQEGEQLLWLFLTINGLKWKLSSGDFFSRGYRKIKFAAFSVVAAESCRFCWLRCCENGSGWIRNYLFRIQIRLKWK